MRSSKSREIQIWYLLTFSLKLKLKQQLSIQSMSDDRFFHSLPLCFRGRKQRDPCRKLKWKVKHIKKTASCDHNHHLQENTYISSTVFSCSSFDLFSSISESLFWPSSMRSCRAISSTS